MNLTPEQLTIVKEFQQNEINEYHVYSSLAKMERKPHNADVLKEIAEDEHKHYHFWKSFTGQEIGPDRVEVFKHMFIARVFGVTFALKLMEGGENRAQHTHLEIFDLIPEARHIHDDEEAHESQLINIIDEDRLKYISSIILGLNDALVEFTGALAGLTFALQNAQLVGLTGLISGIAASLSMGASEYMATRASASGEKQPLRAGIYTTGTYILAIMVLVLPFFIFSSHFLALLCSMTGAVVLIYIFTFYFSVVRSISFRSRFVEMLVICFGIAGVSFFLGLAVRQIFGITI